MAEHAKNSPQLHHRSSSCRRMQIPVTDRTDDHRQPEPHQLGRTVQTPHAGHAPVCTGSVQTLPGSGSSADFPERYTFGSMLRQKGVDTYVELYRTAQCIA